CMSFQRTAFPICVGREGGRAVHLSTLRKADPSFALLYCKSGLHVRLNMSERNNGRNQLPPRPQTKAEIVAQREQVRMLAIALGNWREAARQCGLSEGRVLNWVVRYGWKLPKRIEAPHPREMLSPVVGVVTPAQSLEERLKQDAEATRVGLATATRKASVALQNGMAMKWSTSQQD